MVVRQGNDGIHTKCKPSHKNRKRVVKHLNVEEEHADDIMPALVHTTEMHQGVDTGRKGTVQPSTTLGNKLGSTLGHVGFTLGRLDVGEMPLGAGLGHQFETEDTIFGQEHVLLEDVHALNTLGTELFGEGVITVEVLLQGPTHDGAESVGGERTGQHTDVSERTFQRLVENVTDLVLEILRGDEGIDQLLPPLAQHGVNFTARSTEVLVVVEGLPERQQRLGSGFRSGVQQNTDLRVEDAAKRVEEPSVRVDLLAVLLLQTKHHLHGREGGGTIIVGSDELLVRRHRQLRGVFKLASN